MRMGLIFPSTHLVQPAGNESQNAGPRVPIPAVCCSLQSSCSRHYAMQQGTPCGPANDAPVRGCTGGECEWAWHRHSLEKPSEGTLTGPESHMAPGTPILRRIVTASRPASPRETHSTRLPTCKAAVHHKKLAARPFKLKRVPPGL